MKVHIQSLFIGYIAGAATMALVPIVGPAVKEVAGPVAKVFFKHGLLGLERVRATVARATEAMEDMVAEVRAEVDKQLASKPAKIRVVPIESAKSATSSAGLSGSTMVS